MTPRHEDHPIAPIGVVGLGVVGGTVAAAFEETGAPVRGYDRYLGIGGPEDLRGCGVVFLCVPTLGGLDGNHDLTEVWTATREVNAHVEEGTVVGIKSTSPPGTCDRLTEAFPRLRWAAVPEFLVATRPMETFRRPDRVVIGASSAATAAALAELMARVVPEAPIIVMTPTEAELVKLCSNAMLAAKVALANEFHEVCERLGVSWSRVQGVVGLDRRIGPSHLTVTAERGFGGACLPKDLDGLIAVSRDLGYDPALLEEIAEFNRRIRGLTTLPASMNDEFDDEHAETRPT